MIAPPGTRLVGLLGYPVEHSLSPAMHNAAFRSAGLEWRYTLRETVPDDLDTTIRRCVEEGYEGWNITVPHKERMTAYLDRASAEVRATGACNSVRVEDGRLVGYNTDIAGFLAGLEEAGGIAEGSRAVLLGAGGAARAVALALATSGHKVVVLARKASQASSLANALMADANLSIESGSLDRATLSIEVESAALLVNCTPAGMWPLVEATPLHSALSTQSKRLSPHLLVYDLIYRPRPTRFLTEAAKGGCRTQDGLAMLVGQGAAAFEIWTGLRAPVDVMREACLDALQVEDDRK